jgi:Zn-dependent peptidase ImmA (M78 family)
MTVTAASLLNAHWDGRLPVDVVAIAKSMGISVEPSLAMDESGVIENTVMGTLIQYSASESPVRQRFTIAHEIGHYALGHLNAAGKKYRDTPENFSSGAAPEERQANAFAAKLLMPEKVVKFAVNEKGFNTLKSLAKLFNVSEVAMKYRLVNLGLLSG